MDIHASTSRTVRAAIVACAALAANQAVASGPVVSLLEMRRQHVVIQQWDLSCGAAALTTLLNYQHGENLSEKEVAASLMRRPEYIAHPELIRMREGFSLLDLKREVEGRGYRGLGFGKMEFKDAVEKAPLIVPVQVRGYNHFVVFRGVMKGRVLLADPAWGNRTVSVEEFMESWLEYPRLGRVGFQVQARDGKEPAAHLLAAKAADFPMLGP